MGWGLRKAGQVGWYERFRFLAVPSIKKDLLGLGGEDDGPKEAFEAINREIGNLQTQMDLLDRLYSMNCGDSDCLDSGFVQRPV